MERAVPSTIFMAASTSLALRSGSFWVAISRTWSLVIFATLVVSGFAEPLLIPAAFLISSAAGGTSNREAHIAFAAADRVAVQAFFDAATGAAAEVLHEPREWPEYHSGYYAAFVRDPDGNNVEAVVHS